MIFIENKKRKLENIQKEFPNADILDVTSTSKLRYAQLLSPFYPHRNIPIPFSDGYYATCVEAIWQGLKVFEGCDIDINTFENDTMIGIKRTVKRFGKPLGHRKGIYGTELLNYFDARMQIYLPTYKWMLENVSDVKNVIQRISERAKTHDIVFLDYNTNDNFRDISSPISHAALVKLYIEGNYPSSNQSFTPMSSEEVKEYKGLLKQLKKNNKSNKQQTLF